MADLNDQRPLEEILAVPKGTETNALVRNLKSIERSWNKTATAVNKYVKLAEKLHTITEKQAKSLTNLLKNVEKTMKGYTGSAKAADTATQATERHTEATKAADKETKKYAEDQESISKKMGAWAKAGWGKATDFIGKYGIKIAAGALATKAATMALDEFRYSFEQHIVAGAQWDKSFSSMIDTTWRVNKVMGESAIMAIKYGKSINEVQEIAKRMGKGVGRGSLLAEGGEKQIVRLTEAALQLKRDLMLSDEEIASFFEKQAFRFGKTEEQYTGVLNQITTAARETNTEFGAGHGIWVDQMAQHIKNLTMESQNYSQNTDFFIAAYQKVFTTVKQGTNNFVLATEAAEKFTKALAAPPPWMMTRAGMDLVKDAQSDWASFAKTLGDVSPDVQKQIKDIVDQIGITTSQYQAGQAVMEILGQEGAGLKAVFNNLQGLVKGGGAGGTQLLVSMFGMNYNEAIQASNMIRENDFGAFSELAQKNKAKTKPVGAPDMLSAGGISQMLSGGLTTVSSAVQAPFENLGTLGQLIPMLLLGGAVKKRWPKWRSGGGLLGGLLGKKPGRAPGAWGRPGLGERDVPLGPPSLGGVQPVTSASMNITTATIRIQHGNMGGVGGMGVAGAAGTTTATGASPPLFFGGAKAGTKHLKGGVQDLSKAGKWMNIGGKRQYVPHGAKVPKAAFGAKMKGLGGKVKGAMKGRLGKGLGIAGAIGGLALLAGTAFASEGGVGTPEGAGTKYGDPSDYLNKGISMDTEIADAKNNFMFQALDTVGMGAATMGVDMAGGVLNAAASALQTQKTGKFKSGKSLMDLQIEQAKKNIQKDVTQNVASLTKVTPQVIEAVEQKNKALLAGGKYSTNDVRMPMKIDPTSGNIILQGGYGEIVKMEGKRKLLGAK